MFSVDWLAPPDDGVTAIYQSCLLEIMDNPCTLHHHQLLHWLIIVLMMELKVKIVRRQSSQIIVFPQFVTTIER